MKDKGNPKEVIGTMGTSENLIMTTKIKETEYDPQDQALWELLEKWSNAPSNTASAITTESCLCKAGERCSHPNCQGPFEDEVKWSEEARNIAPVDLRTGVEASVDLRPTEEGLHVCNTVEEGWRPCPAALCEGELLLLERDDRLGEAIENLRVAERYLEIVKRERDELVRQRDAAKDECYTAKALVRRYEAALQDCSNGACPVDYSKEDIKKTIIEFGREKVAK